MLLAYLFGLATGVALLPVIWLIGRRGKDTDAFGKESAAQSSPAGYPAPLIVAVCLPVAIAIAAGGYAALGGAGIAARQAPAPAPAAGAGGMTAEVGALEEFLRNAGNSGEQTGQAAQISALEERLRQNPASGQDWGRLGRLYFEAQRYDDSVRAFGQAMQLLGETPERLADIGEAMTQANGGIVSEEARALFVRANQRDPALVQARFYLALAMEQDGALENAAAAWRALLAEAPAQAFWRPVVEQRLALVTARLSGDAPQTTGNANDRANDWESADAAPPPQQAAMVEQMVTSLAERLEADGDDIDGWLMLMRSYKVLGRTDQAHQALARARNQFAGNEAALKQIEQAADALELR